MRQFGFRPLQHPRPEVVEAVVFLREAQNGLQLRQGDGSFAEGGVLAQQPVNAGGHRALQLHELRELRLGEVALELQQIVLQLVVEAQHQQAFAFHVIRPGQQGDGRVRALRQDALAVGLQRLEGEQAAGKVFQDFADVAIVLTRAGVQQLLHAELAFDKRGVAALDLGEHRQKQARLGGGQVEAAVDQGVVLHDQRVSRSSVGSGHGKGGGVETSQRYAQKPYRLQIF